MREIEAFPMDSFGLCLKGVHFFFPALTFAHLAFAAARMRAIPAGEMWRFRRAVLGAALVGPSSELKIAIA